MYKKTAIFAIDMQNGFTSACPNELPVPNGEKTVAAFQRLKDSFNYMIGSKDAHPSNAIWIANDNNPQFSIIKNSKNADMYWKKHCIVGTEGFELISGMPKVDQFDYFVYKGIEPDMHPYGACFHDLGNSKSTGVIEWLQAKEVGTVLVVGLATDYCVKVTACQLIKYSGLEVAVCLEGCAGISEDTTNDAVLSMRSSGIKIYQTVNETINDMFVKGE